MERVRKMHKILVATVREEFQKEFWSPVVEKKLQEYGFELEILMRGKLSLEELPSDPAVEAVVTTWGSPRFTAAAFDKFPNLKFLGHCAGSVAGVVAPDFYEKGGRVFSANYVMATAVAEWSLLMTLLHSRNFFKSSSVKQGELMDWQEKFSMGNLRESVIGIWGFGDITRHLLKMLKPLNIGRILVSSKHASAEEIEAYGAEKAPFEDLFKYADMVHCLVGVTPDTFHGIGAKELAALKEGAAIINGGRAGLLDEDALCAHLSARRLFAYLDVYYEEPLPTDSQLYSMPNLVMTPHNAGFPGRKEFLPFLLDEFHRAWQGEKNLCEISAKRFETMTVEQLSKKN